MTNPCVTSFVWYKKSSTRLKLEPGWTWSRPRQRWRSRRRWGCPCCPRWASPPGWGCGRHPARASQRSEPGNNFNQKRRRISNQSLIINPPLQLSNGGGRDLLRSLLFVSASESQSGELAFVTFIIWLSESQEVLVIRPTITSHTRIARINDYY